MALDDQRGGPQSASLSFSTQVHTIDALKKAAYRVSAVAAVDIQPSNDEWRCTFSFLKPHSDAETKLFLDNFKIEVLDQGLRVKIADETAAMRNAILALAFSKTGLQGSE